MKRKVHGLNHSSLCVAWGAGVDSTAMLVRMVKIGMRPDLITFADTGAERPATYNFIPVFSDWLESKGFPRPIVCRYQPARQSTRDKYKEAVLDVVKRLGLDLSNERIQQLCGIFGNMVANETLPSIAFGANKSCSVKWKLEAQEPT